MVRSSDSNTSPLPCLRLLVKAPSPFVAQRLLYMGTWSAHLPNTVLAVFTLPESNAGFRARAVDVQNRFLSENGRTADPRCRFCCTTRGAALATYMYDRTSGCDCQAAFSVL